MRISLFVLIGVLSFILAGCNNETGLEGKELGMASFDPTVSSEEQEETEFTFSSNMLVFDFESADTVTLKHNGSTYSGDYSLEDNNLSITLEDEDASLNLEIIEFEETPDEFYSYTGQIEQSELSEDSEGTSQLININNNFSSNETFMFVEES